MNYDFETIRDKLTGVTANENTRRHRLFATGEQLQSELTKYKYGVVRYRSFGIAESDLLNTKLFEIASPTPRQKALMSRTKQLKLRPRVQITLLGTLYLEWCEQPRALVVAGHWQRLTAVDMINQARDAEYTMLIRERASTYSMVGGLV